MPLLPGSTIGILGGGQLGRMLAIEAKKMGYRVITLDPSPDSPCGQVADEQVVAAFDDEKAALGFASKCDVVTYEFENIGVNIAEAIERSGKNVFPSSKVLAVSQNRVAEKQFVKSIGVSVTPFMKVSSKPGLEVASKKIGFPAVLKTMYGGYDGKSQWVVRNFQEAQKAFSDVDGEELILEKFVDFSKEISVICARNYAGDVVSYPVSENIHRANILDTSIIPARISKVSESRARKIAGKIAKEICLVGVFCVEMFLLKDGSMLVNEIAPRPHNSGHYTIDACHCSQFGQQLRAVCGLQLGSTEMHSKAVMVNILADGKGSVLSGIEELLSNPKVKLHLYGKKEAKTGRKMGHFTVLSKNLDEAIRIAGSARKKLKWV